MATRACDYCGKAIDEAALTAGKAKKIGGEYFCPQCVREQNLAEPPAPRKTSTQLLVRSSRFTPPQPHASGARGTPAGGTRRRSTRNHTLPRTSSRRSSPLTDVEDDLDYATDGPKKAWALYVVGGLLFLVGVLLLWRTSSQPSALDRIGETSERTRTRTNAPPERSDPSPPPSASKKGTAESALPSPPSAPSGTPKNIESPDPAVPAPAPAAPEGKTEPEKPIKTPEASDEEVAVLLVNDEEAGADVREERRSWRKEHGTPTPGSKDLLLGDFEDASEILYWSFRPADGISAWLGRKGIASGQSSLRLEIAAKTLSHAETQFYLPLAGDRFWNWKGATALSVRCFNPNGVPITLSLVVKSGDLIQEATAGKVQSAEASVTLAAQAKELLRCPLENSQLDLSHIQYAGIRITRLADRAIALYLDRVLLTGTFSEKP